MIPEPTCLCAGHLEETTRYDDEQGRQHIWFGWVRDETNPECPKHGEAT